jgi:hypothetical protein
MKEMIKTRESPQKIWIVYHEQMNGSCYAVYVAATRQLAEQYVNNNYGDFPKMNRSAAWIEEEDLHS